MTASEPVVLTPGETAERLGLSASRLKGMRSVGHGPAYLVLGRGLIRYLVDDVNDWLATREKRAG